MEIDYLKSDGKASRDTCHFHKGQLSVVCTLSSPHHLCMHHLCMHSAVTTAPAQAVAVNCKNDSDKAGALATRLPAEPQLLADFTFCCLNHNQFNDFVHVLLEDVTAR